MTFSSWVMGVPWVDFRWKRVEKGKECGLPSQALAQIADLPSQLHQLGNGALAGAQDAAGYFLRPGLELAADGGQGDVNAPFVFHGANAGDQAGAFKPLEQRGERAGVQEQALAQLGNHQA